VVVVSQLDSVVGRNAKVFITDVIKLLCDSKVFAVNVGSVYHQEEQITCNFFILVQLLKYLDELSQSEEPFSLILAG
jgi:hypothetical protein